MRILILGSGVVGVTTAYYLAKLGHQVTVVERQPGPGAETSFANAGEVTVGYAGPWSGPGLPLKAMKWMFLRNAPMKFRPKPDLAMLRWLHLWWKHCEVNRYTANKEAMVALARYSLGCLQTLRAELSLEYEQRTLGTLQLFRKPEQMRAAAKDMAVLARLGIAHSLLSADECIRTEPGLAFSQEHIEGGLLLPGDETGDCFAFTKAVAEHAIRAGAEFRFGTTVTGLVRGSGRITHVETTIGPIEADAVVVALGSHSATLLRKVGVNIPVYPLKGYSLTMPLLNESAGPCSTVLDETSKVAITRLGNRVRAGGIAELAGYDLALRPARRASLETAVRALFPQAGDLAQGDFWCGLRPVTPDGPPVLGCAGHSNLYLNTGHGSYGWTMACGSAQITADLISRKQPALPAHPYAAQRYAGATLNS
ncbi:D-amino acid dehydrogenase [Polaromonas sp.]|uniref:D-amino acid dehydrogenase n=1 Tax=Polaromonas sp. TaxID=1869339 RepID=UPI003264429C